MNNNIYLISTIDGSNENITSNQRIVRSRLDGEFMYDENNSKGSLLYEPMVLVIVKNILHADRSEYSNPNRSFVHFDKPIDTLAQEVIDISGIGWKMYGNSYKKDYFYTSSLLVEETNVITCGTPIKDVHSVLDYINSLEK